MTNKSYSNQEQSRAVTQTSDLLYPDPHCTHYLDENEAILLQATNGGKKD